MGPHCSSWPGLETEELPEQQAGQETAARNNPETSTFYLPQLTRIPSFYLPQLPLPFLVHLTLKPSGDKLPDWFRDSSKAL